MSVSSVSSSSSSSSTTSTSSTTGYDTLDRNAFLKLLVTQLKYQDPLSPTDNTEFVSQLAQFSSLEQMQNLNDSFESVSSESKINQAFGMVGKWVEYSDSSGDTVTGKVSSILISDGTPSLVIGSETVALDDVENVYNNLESLGQSKLTTLSLGLIGKTVSYLDSSGSISTGEVDSVSMSDGWPLLNIGDSVIDARNLQSVSNSLSSSDLTDIASAIKGKTVEYVDSTGTTHTGKVTSVLSSDGSIMLMIGTNQVDLDDVNKIY